MKYLLYLLFFTLAACSHNTEQPRTTLPVVADSMIQKKAFTPEPVKLLGTWKATVPPVEDQPATEWEIKFTDSGQYSSFYKPSNRKNGTWSLRGDSLILYTKAVDNFKVLALNDTLLKIKALDKWAYEYSFQKIYSK